jgi:hypothetical protein
MQDRVEVAQKQAASHIKNELKKEDEVLLVFTTYQSITLLVWEHSREFEYKGEMYDIIRSKTQGDSVWYWCYHDKKETKLRKNVQSLLTYFLGTSPQNKTDQQHLVDFFKTLYCHTGIFQDRLPDLQITSKDIRYNPMGFTEIWPDPHFPPPKKV